MGILYTCFCVVDHMLCIQGLQRWYFLKFFIHPLLVLSCEFYMAGRIVFRGIIAISIYPYMLVYYAGVWLLLAMKRGAHQLVVVMGLDDASIIELYGWQSKEEEEQTNEAWFDAWQEEDPLTSITVSTAPRVFLPRNISTMVFVLPVRRGFRWTEEKRTELPLVIPDHHHHTRKEEEQTMEEPPIVIPGSWYDEDEEGEEEVKLVRKKSRVSMEVVIKEEVRREESYEEDPIDDAHESDQSRNMSFRDWAIVARQTQSQHVDEFYQEYSKRWLGLHNTMEDRINVISNLLQVKLQDLVVNMKTHMEIFEQRFHDFAKSMEMDLEMGYVGQSCLCWEALQRHHKRFVELAAAGHSCESYSVIAERFQEFQVRLVRFIENERYDWRYEGKRSWNYIRGRWSCSNLILKVPQVSEEDHDGHGEKMTAADVLRIIDGCIETFAEFLDDDSIKPRKKLKKFPKDVDSPVQYVNDLGLRDTLIKDARKKEMRLKRMMQKGRRKPIWEEEKKKKASVEDSQRYEILFSMIDIKLVKRVLKMSSVPTQHLRWCEEKLNNVDITDGGLSRKSYSSTPSFFPIALQNTPEAK